MKTPSSATMRTIVIAAAVASVPLAVNAQASLRSVSRACEVAGADSCNAWAAGAFETLKDLHMICPDRPLRPAEVWQMTKDYFAPHPDQRVKGALSALVREAAEAKYPCHDATQEKTPAPAK